MFEPSPRPRWVWLTPLILAFPLAALPAAPALASVGQGAEDTPLDMVVLVDESGSLSPAGAQHEIEAAGTISQVTLNPRSRVTVVGFGGANGEAPNQDPTTVVCPPTVTSGTANLEFLARCVGKLHRRAPVQGDNTDYAAALEQALSILGPSTPSGEQSPAGATKVILMMTDGGLDVSGDPQYPQPNWQQAARHAVNIQLAAARAAGIEIWPLGFGTISQQNSEYLDYLAAHGGQSDCDSRPESRPRSFVAQDSAGALAALYKLYAAASCLGLTSAPPVTIVGGQTRVLSVNIPAIASDGAISVNKGNPGIQAVFMAPDGTAVTGDSLGQSTFRRSGQDTAVDVLHIGNPEPGMWKVKLTAPQGLHSQLVSATAFWQGAVRASILASPPSARTGQRIDVTLSVLGPNGPIADPASLSGVHVLVSVTGDGLPGRTLVLVKQAPATASLGAGDYTGSFVAPSARGTLTFTGTAIGYGLHSTNVPTQVSVGSTAALLQATVQVSPPEKIQRGQGISGQVLFTNKTGQSTQARLVLLSGSTLATVSAPRGQITVPSGTSTVPFTISVSRGSPLGPAQLIVRVVQASDLSVSLGNQQLLVTVTKPQGFIGKHRWEILGAALLVLLAVLLVYLRRAARRRRVDVRGLFVSLHRDGTQLGQELKAPSKWAESFRFVIREDDSSPRLDYPQADDEPYVARRGAPGAARVRAPDGASYNHIVIGGAGEKLPSGTSLVFGDTRPQQRRGQRPRAAVPDEQPPGRDWSEPGRSADSWDPPSRAASPSQSASDADERWF